MFNFKIFVWKVEPTYSIDYTVQFEIQFYTNFSCSCRRYDGKFYDTCGRALGFTRWHAGEPNHVEGNENCGHMYAHVSRQGQWNDINCDSKWGYICQYKAHRCEYLTFNKYTHTLL